MALSMIHEGPGPSFIAKEMFSSLLGNPDTVHVTVEALPQSATKDDLQKVSLLHIFTSPSTTSVLHCHCTCEVFFCKTFSCC